ncbi:hypothetical protein LTR29_017861 [Friedmanniomyces endolithicus]|nr:hypothetical protein LTS09_017572 [Friedmanniomyces endolithicus]KAK0302343.1 hypothetical protein LTR01_008812 [Friedmanniomyces endolithicus]KAK0823224.1 hypothetical protein LTR73_008695 [Friedmanniomyces endolithicus]KAK0926467.1 hypothetical protein LTR29_017861 [Friedmanniomyces endolithicus]
MKTSSPPLTPIRNYVSPFETSPASSYREQLRRRTSSFSPSHDLSPVTPRRNRFSNGSQLSHDLPTPGEEGAGGLGNLADELDRLDNGEDYDEDTTEASLDRHIESEKEPRDSGVDVTYNSRKGSPLVRNFSRPLGTGGKPPDEEEDEQEEKLSPDLEDAMHSIARMVSYTSTSEDPLIPRTVALLQDPGKQAGLEAGAQRLSTSTNNPDPAPLQSMQKLDRETTNVIQTLSQLADTLQVGKQITISAARHLRTTQNMVVELRRERERADEARHELTKGNVHERVKERRCAAQCSEVLAGFEDVCEALRASLEQDAG